MTVLSGPNGAGKTNLLEAIYFGATGCSCRTANEREAVRFGAEALRVELQTADQSGRHILAVGFAPGERKRMSVDGAPVERLLDSPERPLVSVFLPDRLELIKGVPALRRAHLDRFVAALWPARAANRRAYAQALSQRNSLLARVRAGTAAASSLDAWDLQLARAAIQLIADRRAAVELVCEPFAELASTLGLEGGAQVAYRPRSRADRVEGLVDELHERRDRDLERAFTTHGPHRDDLRVAHRERELRTYGSQGQQRLGLLALLLAEREVLAARRGCPPLLLLDDVMSELDHARRLALVELVRSRPGQAVITTTDLDHVPAARGEDVVRISVADGNLWQEAIAA